jgi:hypothetical protein
MNSSISAILTNIGLIVSLILTFLTVLEMMKQRRESYKPKIIVKEKFIILKSNKSFDIIDFEVNDCLIMVLKNIGIGPAINIDLEFKFDIEDFKERWNDNFSEKILLSIDKVYVMINNRFTIFTDNNKISYDNLLSNDEIEIVIPSHINTLMKMYVFQFGKSMFDNNDKGTNKDITPKLPIKIRYNDIGGKRYNLNYLVNFDIRTVNWKKENKEIGISIKIQKKL